MNSILRTVYFTLAAGGFDVFTFDGDYIRLKSAPLGGALKFDSYGENASNSFELETGEDAFFADGGFNRIEVTNQSGVEQIFVVQVGRGVKVGSAKISGNVTVIAQAAIAGAGTRAIVSVGSGSTQLLAGNAARKWVHIFNASRVASLFVRMDAGTPTASDMEIKPKGGMYLEGNQCTSSINAISNGNATSAVVNSGI